MRRSSTILCLIGLFVCSAPLLAASDLDLTEVLQRFDRVQDGIKTLSADFTETTESALLLEPITAMGRLYLTKPDSVRWEYHVPEEMSFVIYEDEYTGYFPARKKAERRDIHRWREQLFRFLGLGQASSELGKFYDIALGATDADSENSYLLIMTPKKKRVRKKMDAVRFWIDDETFLPVRVEYHSKSGNRRVIDFDTMTVNPDLTTDLYRMEIPSDVKMTKGFSALSGFSASAD
jgi:outer membrane lipoprotein-sorting protein